MQVPSGLSLSELAPHLDRFWQLSANKLDAMRSEFDPTRGSPVFTVNGKYTQRGWTEWTEGFYYGSNFLQFEATGEDRFADFACTQTCLRMAPHVSHVGVHDHGFNNVSTYGAWLRLMREGRLPTDPARLEFLELALKLSGAAQATRWSPVYGGGGYIYSFNGPHSLFVDTVRSVRALMLSDALGHRLQGENDCVISLFERGLQHLEATARFSVYYGEGRDSYDEAGRVAHESVFNPNDARYRCPNSQQGYSGFTTWTRGLAWALVGFAEEAEFLAQVPEEKFASLGGRARWLELCTRAARVTADWYLANTASDGIPYWDGGAPNLSRLGNYRERPSEPHNDWEPVDSSAAAIAAQGLLRLGVLLGLKTPDGARYRQAGLGVMRTLLSAPYLSESPSHHGILLHSVYHRPNGWDHIPAGRRVPCDEASMWGDYHVREAALMLTRELRGQPTLTFFNCLPKS
ncbi:glycosyl hydrolase [Nibricoccus sp. IMCC34717]|uniref:glycosyl hydrolase n=1 Tax=Nibricoccus sp. IMCC34717 TaxID=3034021 RepID=UPI00384B5597